MIKDDFMQSGVNKVVYLFRNIKNNNYTNNKYDGENKSANKFLKDIPVNCFKKHERKGKILNMESLRRFHV